MTYESYDMTSLLKKIWKLTFDFRKNARKDKVKMMLIRKNLQKKLFLKVKHG